MSNLYNRLQELCERKGISGYRMCKDVGIQPSIMTDLKMGRRSSMKAETAQKVAEYFGVTVGYLLGHQDKGGDGITFEDGAGFGGGDAVGCGFGNGSGYGGPLLPPNAYGTKKVPTQEGERTVSDDDIKFALFGGDGEITDAMYDEVKRFAQMVKLREEAEKKKE